MATIGLAFLKISNTTIVKIISKPISVNISPPPTINRLHTYTMIKKDGEPIRSAGWNMSKNNSNY